LEQQQQNNFDSSKCVNKIINLQQLKQKQQQKQLALMNFQQFPNILPSLMTLSPTAAVVNSNPLIQNLNLLNTSQQANIPRMPYGVQNNASNSNNYMNSNNYNDFNSNRSSGGQKRKGYDNN
jgi:hypothetical protein